MIYNKKTNKKLMNKLEKKTATELNMTRCPLSGGSIWKGDMRDSNFVIDMKYTYAKGQITIKKTDLIKLDNEAFDCGKIPVMLISIDGFERYLLGREEFLAYKEWRELNE